MYKKDDKVTCIENNEGLTLTVGQIYTVHTDDGRNGIYVEDGARFGLYRRFVKHDKEDIVRQLLAQIDEL